VEKLATPRKRAKKEPVSKADAVSNAVDTPVEEPRGKKYWLMKAEPESRIVKGKVESQLAMLT
jgi:hypothetical protein